MYSMLTWIRQGICSLLDFQLHLVWHCHYICKTIQTQSRQVWVFSVIIPKLFRKKELRLSWWMRLLCSELVIFTMKSFPQWITTYWMYSASLLQVIKVASTNRSQPFKKTPQLGKSATADRLKCTNRSCQAPANQVDLIAWRRLCLRHNVQSTRSYPQW